MLGGGQKDETAYCLEAIRSGRTDAGTVRFNVLGGAKCYELAAIRRKFHPGHVQGLEGKGSSSSSEGGACNGQE